VPEPLLSVDQLLEILAATPARITALTKGLSAARLLMPPQAGEWSARDVLAHLRACSDVWGRYIALILEQDRPAFKAVSPRTYIKKTDYLEQAFRPALRAFTAQRAGLLDLLKPLPPRAWSRSATVTGAGRPHQISVQAYADRLARHEREHVRQVERIATTLRS